MPRNHFLLLKIVDSLKEAAEVQEREQDRRKAYADESRRPTAAFQVGGLVTVKTRVLNSLAQGTTSKFAPRRDGSYRISKLISPVSYQVADYSTGEVTSIRHASDLEAWRGEESSEISAKPTHSLKKRGRPKRPETPLLSRGVGSLPEVPVGSKGGDCSAKGPVTHSRVAIARAVAMRYPG